MNKEVKELKITPIKMVRMKTGLQLEEAADKLQISKSTLYKIEQGHSTPGIKLVDRMRKVYRCTSDEILDKLNFEDQG